MTKELEVVTGSIAATAEDKDQTIAEAFVYIRALAMVDTSGSMATCDAPGRTMRYEAACDGLRSLQLEYPGTIAVVGFSKTAALALGGIPAFQKGRTDMVAALEVARPFDDAGIRLIMISDGQPDDPTKTLAVAQTFVTHIDTIYIGPEDRDAGRRFLELLAETTGGQAMQSAAPGVLEAPARLLLQESTDPSTRGV